MSVWRQKLLQALDDARPAVWLEVDAGGQHAREFLKALMAFRAQLLRFDWDEWRMDEYGD